MPRRGFPSLTSGGRTPSYHTRRNPPSDYPAATVTGGRALPNSLAALSRIRWPTRAEICKVTRPGLEIKDDKLYMFGHEKVTVVRIWDKPAGWIKTKKTPYWAHCRPDIDLNMASAKRQLGSATAKCKRFWPDYFEGQLFLPAPFTPWLLSALHQTEDNLRKLTSFFMQIPPEIRSHVSCFPMRQFSLISFCARCPGGYDLLRATPALALMLANSWVFRAKVARPLRSARALLRRKQREQLEWLCFPICPEAAVRILRRIPPELCTVELLLDLRQAMATEDTLKLLFHLPRINRGAVRIVHDRELRSIATPRLLQEVASEEQEDYRACTAYHLKRILAFYQVTGKDHTTLRINGLEQLYARFEWLLDFGTGWPSLDSLARFFPPPPVEGIPGIVPLRTPVDLFIEGHEQRHCIANYTHEIAEGWAYAYRVVNGQERATALITVPEPGNRHDYWTLGACKAKANNRVSDATILKLEQWLTSHQAMRLPPRSIPMGRRYANVAPIQGNPIDTVDGVLPGELYDDIAAEDEVPF